MVPIQYFGSININSDLVYSTDDIKALFPEKNINMMKMKTDKISVGIDESGMFQTSLNDEAVIGDNQIFVFSEDCIIAVGRYIFSSEDL